ncbi:MAG: HNH endonuclease [Clostridia bacterium]|nr:HNH endonuclease [Clostridia bacterium]
MPKKNRITIPNAIADKVLFNHNRTCCVCRIPNKEVQIHHIDENPANNAINNLAVLCLDCHNKTQITGGFGRHLNAGQIILYRDQWLEMVKERNHTLALASLSIEKSNINSWKKVDFSNQCGIENAIAGLGLNQNNVISCPKLPIFDEAYKNVDTLHFVNIIGESGSGKSLTAFQIAYEFFKKGYDIYSYIGGEHIELISHSPALYIIDNAHLHQAIIDKIKTKVNSNIKLICVYTDSTNVKEQAVRITTKQAVDVLYEYYKKNAQSIIPIVKKFNRNLGVEFGDISYANLIESARMQNNPYSFNYIIRGAADYIKDKIVDYKKDGVSEILTIIALHQILTADDFITTEKINELIEPKVIAKDFETKLVFNDKTLVKNNSGYKFSHIHTAINYLIYYILNSFDNQTFANKTFWSFFNSNTYSLQGLLWLVNNLRSSKFNYKTNRQILSLFTTAEIESIYDKLHERKNEPYFLNIIERIEHYLRNRNVNDKIDEYINIINSCQIVDLPSVGAFINMQINKGNDNNYLILKKIQDNIDHSRILNLFNESSSEAFIYFVYFFNRLSYGFKGWNKKVTKYLDIDKFTLKIKNISMDYLYSIVNIAATFSFRDKNLTMIRDACVDKILFYLNKNPIETWQQIDDNSFFILWGYHSIYNRTVKKSQYYKTVQAKFIDAVDPSLLASQISSNILYHWQSIANLLEVIYCFDKNKYFQIIKNVNLNALSLNLHGLWGTSQEFEFLRVFYYDSKILENIIFLCELDIEQITMDILFFSTTGAIYLNKKGKKFNIESCRNEYILIEGLLKLAKKDIQLSISLIVENKEKLIEFIKGSINDFDDSDIKLKKFLHKSLNEIKNELSQSELSQEELDTLLNLNNYNLTNTTNN